MGNNNWGVGLSNSSRNVLMAIGLDRRAAPAGLYFLTEGKLAPVAVPGQEMPGGGRMRNLLYGSSVNDMGQHAFVARLEEGGSAAYLVEASGNLSLILKSGAVTNLGTVTGVGITTTSQLSWGVGLNNKGQIALPIQVEGQKAMIALLTPTGP